MRQLLLFVSIILFIALPAQAGQKLTNQTILHYGPGHGTQVEYMGANGKTYLWYPGNRVILPGQWKLQGGTKANPAQICFKYGPNTYNPYTGVYGSVWECEPMSVYRSTSIEQADGDIFGLSTRSKPPFRLSSQRTTLDKLMRKLK